jgi:hypothetical protein
MNTHAPNQHTQAEKVEDKEKPAKAQDTGSGQSSGSAGGGGGNAQGIKQEKIPEHHQEAQSSSLKLHSMKLQPV